MTKDHSIVITDARGFGRWVRRMTFGFVGGASFVVLPIGLGVYVESTAMQWAGFIMGMMLLFAFNLASHRQHRFRTTDEARDHLDKIDRGDV